MTRTYWLLLFTFGMLATCQRKVKFNPPPDEVKVDSGIVLIDTASNIRSFKGMYIHGNEVSTFRDCTTGKVYWLTDSTGRMVKLYENATKTLAYPYESVYAEVQGHLRGKSETGYASEFENELIVKDIIRVQPKNFRTECYAYEFIALGNEPFWSLEIIPIEERIVLKDVGAGKVYQFPCISSSSKDGIIRYEATSFDKKSKIDIRIKKESCSDGMSDQKYNYSSTVIIDGKILNGCVVKKGDRI